MNNLEKRVAKIATIAVLGLATLRLGQENWRLYREDVLNAIFPPEYAINSNNTYIDSLEAEVKRTKRLSFDRVQKDVSHLQGKGFDINEKDLFYTTKVVAGEAGNYKTFVEALKKYISTNKTIPKQNEDMNAIMQNIISRYIAAHEDGYFQKRFADSTDNSWYTVVMKKPEFSIANSEEWRKSIDSTFKEHKNALDRSTYPDKVFRAYAQVIFALLEFKRNPLIDITDGSISYKNNDETNHVWNNKVFGGVHPHTIYTFKHTKRIGDHWHYTIVNQKGHNPIKQIRERYARRNLYK